MAAGSWRSAPVVLVRSEADEQQANLVDILYLFDSGALIDFTTSELVSLIRALFADSEKRDDAIERIEKGETRAGEASGASSA